MGRALTYFFSNKEVNTEEEIEDGELYPPMGYENSVSFMYNRIFTQTELKEYIDNSLMNNNYLEVSALSYIMSEWDECSYVVINSN